MILDKATADKKLRRMALEVAERNYQVPDLVLIGIRENGIFIAKKIAEYLQDVYDGTVKVVSLAIDKKNPGSIQLSEEVDCRNKTILLVDDVANSGRTMLYALKPILEQFPSQVQTLALVARTHKQFPVDVNYVGMSVSTTRLQMIVVDVVEGEIMGAKLI
jgi:pyrimidine operon attenuation protein/uracil phosphoribosyltransferase